MVFTVMLLPLLKLSRSLHAQMSNELIKQLNEGDRTVEGCAFIKWADFYCPAADCQTWTEPAQVSSINKPEHVRNQSFYTPDKTIDGPD